MSRTGDGKKLATFNIDTETWEAFKAKARENGANASSLLNQWVKAYLENLDSLDITPISQTSAANESLVALVSELIDSRLPAAIEAHLGKG